VALVHGRARGSQALGVDVEVLHALRQRQVLFRRVLRRRDALLVLVVIIARDRVARIKGGEEGARGRVVAPLD